jgi:hypothetical protein
VLAERRDRDVDQAAVVALQRLVAEAPLLQRPRREALQEEVGSAREVPQRAAPVVAFEVEDEAALAGIGREPVGPDGLVAAPALRQPPARGVAAGWLDLDDVRAEVGQDLPGQVAERAGEVEDRVRFE